MLVIPGVKLSVRGPQFFRALDQQAREFASRPREGEQNWREIRTAFIKLDLNNATDVMRWLGAAGYVPRVGKFDLRAPDFASDETSWSVEYVSAEILLWLRQRQAAAAWLMKIPQKRFREAINAARGTRGIVFEAEQNRWKLAIGAPADLDARSLYGFLLTGIGPTLHAFFFWGARGRPAVTIDCDTPMEAIALSIHIDRNFSARQWATCPRCGNGFERERGTDKYCSDKCRNFVVTNARREKVRSLLAANKAWRELPRKKRKEVDRWEWISKHAPSGAEITAEWAKRELSKVKSKGDR